MALRASFPDLRALDLYVSVVEHGSLSGAARAHGIAQPSASSRIRTLERQLGVQLLERSPSGSAPTPAGTVVAGWADTVLQAAHALDAGVAALQTEHRGRLRISASYTIAEYLLPGWLGRFLRDHPEDSIALEVANSTAVVTHLERGLADLGFVETPLHATSMNERVVAHDQLVTVVAADHPWATVDGVALHDLAETPLIMREEGSGTRAALLAELDRVGLPHPRSVLELGSTAAVRSAVTTGSSPTVISRLAVADDLERGDLVEVAVDGLRIERELRAVWPVGHTLSALAELLLQAIEAGSHERT